MNASVLLLSLLNFVFIGLLPIVFFRRDGHLKPLWWLTAVPFFVGPLFLLASYAGLISPLTGYGTPAGALLSALAVPLHAGSISLIAFTLGTHRRRIALWHQDNDAPESIVTYGAYARVRHPFYAAFLLALLGALIFCPQWGTLLTFVYGYSILNLTAAQEERRLRASEFGREYEAYMRRTGRFVPRWRSATV